MKTVTEAFKRVDCQEKLVFNILKVMRPYIEDLNAIDHMFCDVDARDAVADDIWKLRRRSCEQIASLFKRFSTNVQEDEWHREVMSILFPFLQDQLQVRLRLLGVYWERTKAQQFIASCPGVDFMGEMIGPLATLIQECIDKGCGAEEHVAIDDGVAAVSPTPA